MFSIAGKLQLIPKYRPRFEVNRQGTTILRKSLLTSKSERAASPMVTLCEAKFGEEFWWHFWFGGQLFVMGNNASFSCFTSD
jgi:hypothetical protein